LIKDSKLWPQGLFYGRDAQVGALELAYNRV